VGISCVNALSDWMKVEVYRDGKAYTQSYKCGKPDHDVKMTGKSDEQGTRVTFHPDPAIFGDIQYSFDTLSARLRELAFLNPGARITILDERDDKQHSFHYEGRPGGVREVHERPQKPPPPPTHLSEKRAGRNVLIEVGVQYNDSYNESIFRSSTTSTRKTAAPISRGSDRRSHGS
jgi:DNA gyrase subunit B